MLRGVKKQIIEVTNTENEYFEKAILVVSDKYIECDKERLNKKANEYVCALNPFSNAAPYNSEVKGQDRVKILISAFKYFIVCAAGATLSYFLIR